MQETGQVQFRFGDYTLDADRRELTQHGTLVAVEPQVFDLLLYLIENRDRVVSKDDLLDAVWGGRIVSESTLTSRINAARRAIGDSGDRQEMIRTLARKGFRFVAAVTEGSESAAPSPPGPAQPLASAPQPAVERQPPQLTVVDQMRRQVSVLAAEVVTPFQDLEAEDPEAGIAIVGPLMQTARREVERCGGIVLSSTDAS